MTKTVTHRQLTILGSESPAKGGAAEAWVIKPKKITISRLTAWHLTEEKKQGSIELTTFDKTWTVPDKEDKVKKD